jgi:hypothetical protein
MHRPDTKRFADLNTASGTALRRGTFQGLGALITATDLRSRP